MKRIVISDTHIGSKYYKEQELLSFLSSIKYDQLILAGDIIDFIRVPEFTTRAINIAKALDFSKEIIYIVGNHDTPLTAFAGQEAFGMKFVKEFCFEENGKTFRIEHGDRYDDFGLMQNNFFMSFLSVFQSYIEKVFNYNLSDWITDLKMKKRKFRRIWDIIQKNLDVDVFICGHFHLPECIIWVHPNQEIKTYVNSGDWVSNSTYVEILDGTVRLREYQEPI